MFLKRASKLIILHAPQNSALVREADWVLMASSSRLADARREIASRRPSDCLVFGVARGPFLGVRSRPASPANRGWRRQGQPARAGGGVVWPRGSHRQGGGQRRRLPLDGTDALASSVSCSISE